MYPTFFSGLPKFSFRNRSKAEQTFDFASETSFRTTWETKISPEIETITSIHDPLPEEVFENEYLRMDRTLNLLETNYRSLKNQQRDGEADLLFPQLQQCRTQVQEMNLHINHLTSRDIQNIQAVFQPPTETYYVDPETNQKYFEGDHSKVMRLVRNHFHVSEYKGFGLSKYEVMTNPKTGQKQSCLVLYCKKKELQVQYETENIPSSYFKSSFLFNFFHENSVRECQRRQEDRLPALDMELKRNVQQWGFESYQICDSKDLEKLGGLSTKYAQERHGIIFFRKKVQKSSEGRIEEIIENHTDKKDSE